MWVQLTSIQHIEIAGKMRTFYPGDWVDIGKQTAKLWLSRRDAVLHSPADRKALSAIDATIVVQGSSPTASRVLQESGAKVVYAAPHLPAPKTVIWDAAVDVRAILFAIGLGLLDTWEMAAPLWDYRTLAAHVGDEADREKTKALVHDLRVPLYDPRLLFVKKTPETEQVIQMWQDDQGGDSRGDSRLAFLRAVYTVKPFILALPTNWSGHDAPGG